ncbi:methyl farnesoate epoxidase-like [Sitodiplosis mosellana]|uniref:methyl farnesoate epoxidase-like n=1 Tax=Sitodiplosis mosellana TaxID=263140 RepID=UPI0024448578|nr:methyl farnesoate epoxidase-like [Sitodiplosis mosellana]
MFLVFVLIVTVLGLLLIDSRKPKHFPPGPRWLPSIGNLFLVHKLRATYGFFYLVWHHFYQSYGPVVGIRIGRTFLVIVLGRDAIREFYNMDSVNGRPIGFFYRIRTFNKRLGVVFNDGDFWDIQRKFSLKVLRQMGMGRANMIEQIESECIEMVKFFTKKSTNDQLIEMQHAFDIPVLNILWTLIAGYRFEHDDERLQKLLKMIHECFRVVDMTGGILNLLPWVRYFIPVKSGYKPLVDNHKQLWSFLREVVNETRAKNSNERPKSFINSYLEELESKSNGENIHGSFSDEQLLSICLDFFQAGTETTSNTLSFGLMYMVHNRRVCDQVQAELDAVIGQKRFPNLQDRNHLPYVEAVLSEIQRFSNVAPLGIAHRTTENTQFKEYVIPKDTVILMSLYSVNMDKDYWHDPDIFRPERFLNENGEYIPHTEQFLPFGLGKRRCMGENLAKASLFLYFATFMHAFNMIVPNNVSLPNIKPIDGITLQPRPFKLQLKPRF